MLMINIFRIIMVLTGGILFLMTISSLAKRRMTESFCLTWGLVAIIIILGGVVLKPYGLANMISPTGLILIVIVGYCAIFGVFYITSKLSQVTRKNQELAIQLSLVNQENRVVMQKIREIEKELEKAKAEQ